MAGGTHSWTFDAPSGTYKSHTITSKLYEAAVENSRFMPFTVEVPGFGRKKGDTVTLTKITAISEPTSAVLTEQEKISEDDYTISTTSITVSEYGRAVPLTNLVQDLAHYDLGNSVEKELRRQMTLTLDTVVATAFKTAALKYSPTGLTSSQFDTGSSFTVPATANLNVFHMEEIYDLLYDTYLAPPWEGDDYIGIFRHLSVRGLMRDTDWIEWHKYTTPSSLEKNEVGKIRNIRVIDTNHANALGKVGTSSVLGEGVVFGEDAVGRAIVQEPELRMKQPDDYGRSQGIAWYGIMGYGAIYTTANAGQSRIIHVGSTS